MFVGRATELQSLDLAYDSGKFQMAVVYGRRRVGKTSLIREFSRDKRTLFFTAQEQSDSDNLADFSREIARFFGLPSDMRFGSWRAAIDYICDQSERERFVLVLDEFPYAAKRFAALPSLLQIAIDHRLQDTQLFLVLCGSNQGFMESDVLGYKSPLYGRRTLQVKLKPFGYREAAEMLPWMDADEAFRTYACIGGVPYYLSQVREGTTLKESLAQLYFRPPGFLYSEPELLLRQELSEPAAYYSVLRAVAGGANRPKAIAERTGIERNSIAGYLSTLVDLDILERAVPFGDNPDRSKRAVYRMREAMFDYWFTFVSPNVAMIDANAGDAVIASISEEVFATYLGHWFERVCGGWMVSQALSGRFEVPVASVSSWWGTDPVAREQVDIDVIGADASGKRLVVGECKYRNSFDETEALRTLEKRAALIKGCVAEELVLFSKHAVSAGTRRKVDADKRLHAVCLDELYGR